MLAACGSSTGPSGDDGDDLPTFVAQAEVVAQGLAAPVLVTAPVGDPRLFVVEQPGRIRAISDGALAPEPYLDIRAKVGYGGERGLLGLAFDPDFRANGRFFVAYTDLEGDFVLEAYMDADSGDRADPTSGVVFLRVEQPYSNHNGGHIAFGPDGMLYVGLGDGGSGGDPHGHGQDLSTLLGSLLRIDVSRQAGPPYEVPPDNPFVGVDGARPEIWAYGLRNPWRFSFDPHGGTLYIGDVGQSRWEEIDAVGAAEGGHNFGWNTMEGQECFGGTSCSLEGLTLPVAVYGHDQGCSVTGGYAYNGNAIPALQGRYLYADYCEGWVRTFVLDPSGQASDPATLALGSLGWVTSFGEDAQGELYIVTAEGSVFLIAPGG